MFNKKAKDNKNLFFNKKAKDNTKNTISKNSQKTTVIYWTM